MPDIHRKLTGKKAWSVAEAAREDERVYIHCMSCGRSRCLRARQIAVDVQGLPFGMIVGGLYCRRCEQSIAAVFPWWAPTPAAWAVIVRAKRQFAVDVPRPSGTPADFNFQVEERTRDDDYVATVTLCISPAIANAAFDLAQADRARTRFVIVHHARVVRDSMRDFKVVKESE
ncbi:MAG: hypothetical protein WDM91_10775 [Rhizomicrobium sp.]